MRRRGFVGVTVVVVCSLAVVLGAGLAAGSRKQKLRAACRHGLVRDLVHVHPRLLRTTPPAALTSILEVLRRPASSADRLASGEIMRLGYSALWIDYVRLLDTGPGQTRYFLIPGIENPRLPAGCVRTLSPRERRRYESRVRARRAGTVTLEARGKEGLDAQSYTAPAIEAGKTLLVTAGPSNSTFVVSGLAPDGVASVTIATANGNVEAAPVAGNFFLTQTPAGGLAPLTIQWYATDGSLIKTIHIEHLSVLPIKSGPTEIDVSPPAEVVQAAGRQLAEFEQGRTVVAQSGCLACHRLGQAGNAGPGSALTHVGSRLSRHGIKHALLDPTAPMPSFTRLPAARLKALVTFLSELR
jgi:Cytochrome C oxidase, cbb3-type, subunit III